MQLAPSPGRTVRSSGSMKRGPRAAREGPEERHEGHALDGRITG